MPDEKITLEKYGQIVEDAWTEYNVACAEAKKTRDESKEVANAKYWKIYADAQAELEEIKEAAEATRREALKGSWFKKQKLVKAEYDRAVAAAYKECRKITSPMWNEMTQACKVADIRYNAVIQAATNKRDHVIKAAEAKL